MGYTSLLIITSGASRDGDDVASTHDGDDVASTHDGIHNTRSTRGSRPPAVGPRRRVRERRKSVPAAVGQYLYGRRLRAPGAAGQDW